MGATARGRSRSACGWGRRPRRTSWGARGMAGRIRRARRSRRSSAIPTGTRLRSRSRTAPGAERDSSPRRSRCCRPPIDLASSASYAPTSSASSAVTARSPWSAWTSRSTGGCRRSSSQRWTSSLRFRGWDRQARCSAEPDRFDEQGFYGAAEPGTGRRLEAPLPAAGPRHPGRAAPDRGPARHDGRSLRDRRSRRWQRANWTDARRSRRSSPRPPLRAGRRTSAGALRPACDAGVPAARARIRRDTFFARTVPSSETPARLYLGIASQGRNPKVLMRRVLLALMGAAAHAWHEADGERNPAQSRPIPT